MVAFCLLVVVFMLVDFVVWVVVGGSRDPDYTGPAMGVLYALARRRGWWHARASRKV